MNRNDEKLYAWSPEDLRQIALEQGDVELAVRKLAPGPAPKTISARPKPGRPTRFSKG